jgi:DNA (cytosine-5)-methyltransferase 1
MSIPVVDIFAGPGGLGEGFCSCINEQGDRFFSIRLSIEKDFYAHKTLLLRSFYRQFSIGKAPRDYYDLLKGYLTLEELFFKWPEYYEKAKNEVWHAELGHEDFPNEVIDARISKAIGNNRNWLLIGGPPCQAYSIIGRSRRQELILDESKDIRVGLYKQYLRILAVHNPACFVMENVKGLLSAEDRNASIFARILADLKNPSKVLEVESKDLSEKPICPGYKLYSFVKNPRSFDIYGNPNFEPNEFIVQSEKFGIPQTRHRVIILGIRKDIDFTPDILHPSFMVPINAVLSGLPKLRSGLSKISDTDAEWKQAISKIINWDLLCKVDSDIWNSVNKNLNDLSVPPNSKGSDYIASTNISIDYLPEWYLDKNIEGVCNHEARTHIVGDLHRYFYAASFAEVKKVSPNLQDFPASLLPKHKSVSTKNFADRFRVQLWDEPGKTITSHISKDGHYYIHPDSSQCRSLTVREAARIQTFPDNYFFLGPRTSQFIQVGNAVPPLLASKIAMIIKQIFTRI